MSVGWLASCGSHTMMTENGMKIENKRHVNLGLKSKTRWAGWNVGAKSPEEYGIYVAWGETEPKEVYVWSNYSYLTSDPADEEHKVFSKYSYDTESSLIGDSTADVATAQWGEKWCMPTKEQKDELLRDCEWTWTRLNGVNGYAVKGPNGKAIFMPAAGTYFASIDNGKKCYNEGITLYYWCGDLVSSEAFKGERANCLIYEEDYAKFYDRNGDRCDGKTVRAVRKQ